MSDLSERREEALGYGVIMAVAALAHRVFRIMSPDERSPVHAGELRALIRVDPHPALRFALPCRYGVVSGITAFSEELTEAAKPISGSSPIAADDAKWVGKRTLRRLLSLPQRS